MNYIEVNKITLNGKVYLLNDLFKLGGFKAYFGTFFEDWMNEKDYFTVSTSGSTGTPKKIKIPKQYALNSAKATCNFFNINNKTNGLLSLPISFIGGKMMVVRALYSGMNLIYVNPSKNPLKEINEKIDFLAVTPYQLSNILLENEDKLKQIKNIIVGGAPIEKDLEKKIKLLPNNIYSTFGMTETISHIALKNIKKNNFFEALDGVSFEVNENNCLIIKAPYIGVNKLQTNDVVELISDKKFMWVGRYDNVINSGGIKIFPEKIEDELRDKISGVEFVITAIKDNVLGEKLVLLVKEKDRTKEEELKKHINTLSKYSKPKQIIYVKDFMYTKNGKIDRLGCKKILNK